MDIQDANVLWIESDPSLEEAKARLNFLLNLARFLMEVSILGLVTRCKLSFNMLV